MQRSVQACWVHKPPTRQHQLSRLRCIQDQEVQGSRAHISDSLHQAFPRGPPACRMMYCTRYPLSENGPGRRNTEVVDGGAQRVSRLHQGGDRVVPEAGHDRFLDDCC